MGSDLFSLPIDDVMPQILKGMSASNRLILAAPPGAGKTTRVPLALMDEPWAKSGKILVLEPRRIAARAAATRMATTLGEEVGRTIGLRARLDVRSSEATRIEVITEGVFTRMLLDDPELTGISAVLFDEFHERSLDADLGLTLALEAQSAFREDLKIMPMSATLDTDRLAAFLNCQIVVSEGRAHPVKTIYVGRQRDSRIEADMTAAILSALREEQGSILCFLPGAAEIRRVADRLISGEIADNVVVAPLYGALSPSDQDLAIHPATAGERKIVLATDIAESSLTIEGVRIVIDSGLCRVPKFDPQLGASRLETIRISRASADQRQGRAGRTEPGICYRLWNEAANRGLPAFADPEILNSDITGLALDLLKWGERDPDALSWMDPPPKGSWRAAIQQLDQLGARDENGSLSTLGERLGDLPLPPALSAMVFRAGEENQASLAAEIAALCVERGLGGRSVDVRDRLLEFRNDKSQRGRRMRDMAKRWARLAGDGSDTHRDNAGVVIARAYPDRIAHARPGQAGVFLMANGRAAMVDAQDRLAIEPWLAVADLTGGGATMRIQMAAPIDEADAKLIGKVETSETAQYDTKLNRVTARKRTQIGSITLHDTALDLPEPRLIEAALIGAIQSHGLDLLPASDALEELIARLNFVRRNCGEPWPLDFGSMLNDRVEDWLSPMLSGARDYTKITDGKAVTQAKTLLDWSLASELERLAPERWKLPTNDFAVIDYRAENGPVVSAKAQAFFGLNDHPRICENRVPLMLELLSPAQRPIALTRDIQSFWTGGYVDMRKDMRGRYPKHDWPEDPANAPPQKGAKKRK